VVEAQRKLQHLADLDLAVTTPRGCP
jgi:hypothetical protein